MDLCRPGPKGPKCLQHLFAQPPTAGVTNVVDSALHAGVELGKADLSLMPCRETSTEVLPGTLYFACLHASVIGKDNQPEPGIPTATGATRALR